MHTRSDIPGLEDYALTCRRVGQRVVYCGGTWWREVRFCFFRPLLPFLAQSAAADGLPLRASLGGYQYPAYAGGEPANSFLTHLAFTDAKDYSLGSLHPRLQRYVRAAGKRFRIAHLSDKTACKAEAHPVYLDFYHRTAYSYLRSRVHKSHFDHWVDAEFADPGLVALGAWLEDSLVAVSLSRIVGTAWVYSSFFATSEGLRQHVANLMLHNVRERAAAAGRIAIVYVGMPKQGTAASIDEFYLRRGATLIRRPAVLHVNSLAKWALLRYRPLAWSSLLGRQPMSADSGEVTE